MKTVSLRMAVVAGVLAAPSAFATPYDTLESVAGNYNMFLLGDLGTPSSPYGADMQGAVAVGGNAYLSSVGVDTTGGGPAALVVGGNLNQTGGTDSGNVFVGGSATLSGGATISGSLSMTGANGSLTSNGASSPSAIYVTSSTQVNDPAYWATPSTSGGPAAPVDSYGTATDLLNASTSLANAGTTTVTSSGGNITITLTQSGLNVVNLNLPAGATINGINIVNAAGVVPTGLVINVNGNNLNFNGWTYNLGSLSQNQVLFNFPTATAVTLSNLAFEGDILAPLAQVDFISGQIQGNLIAGSYIGGGQINLGSGPEFTLPAYTAGSGSGTAPIPEPGSLVLIGTGLLAIATLRRRGFFARLRT